MSPMAFRARHFALILVIGSLWGVFSSPAQAQEQASRDLGVKVTAGGSEDFLAFGLEGSLKVTERVAILALGEAWGRTYTILSGPVGPQPEPDAPYDAAGFSAGAGARADVIESPRTFLAATAGLHWYMSGDEPEPAPFLGLGAGQAWTVLTHFELGWEVKVRRVAAYQKARYFREEMETRETTVDREYLFALLFSVGGVF